MLSFTVIKNGFILKSYKTEINNLIFIFGENQKRNLHSRGMFMLYSCWHRGETSKIWKCGVNADVRSGRCPHSHAPINTGHVFCQNKKRTHTLQHNILVAYNSARLTMNMRWRRLHFDSTNHKCFFGKILWHRIGLDLIFSTFFFAWK